MRDIVIVTAYVPIPDHPRDQEQYRALGRRLTDEVQAEIWEAQGVPIEDCWLYKYLINRPAGFSFTHSVSDNPKKNSLWYHIVQAQKTEFLYGAHLVVPAKIYVWLDYGIFHVPGVTAQIIDDFIDRARAERAIAIPGCWKRGEFTYDDKHPCWRFCGGVMVVPYRLVTAFDQAMQLQYRNHIERTKNVSWEVNMLTELEEEQPDIPIWWYQADHDASLFTAYTPTGANPN